MLSLLNKLRGLEVSHIISPEDRMIQSAAKSLRHYLYVGQSDLLSVWNVLSIRSGYNGGDAEIQDILDFGCGHGRVVRWFSAGFPNAQIHVTDLDRSAVEFCIDNFGCRPLPDTIPQAAFDLVWVGSVFTHLPASAVESLMQQLLASLKKNGVFVFTTQGRHCIERMTDFDWGRDDRGWMHYNLDRARFETIVDQYREIGYGYVDYPGQKGYGVCIAESSWYSKRMLQSEECIQILFQEKGSDNHQDVHAFMRAPVRDSSKGPLWQPA